MGFEKIKRPVFSGNNAVSARVATAGTVLPSNGVVILAPTAAGDSTYKLPVPKTGATLVVTAVKSTRISVLRTNTTAVTFFNSTKQAISLTTAADRKVAELIAISTAPGSTPKWMVKFLSTGATIA